MALSIKNPEAERLARALAGAGRRAEAQALVAQLLPEAERHGLRGAARDLRELQGK